MIADATTGDRPIAMVIQNSRVLRICILGIAGSSTLASHSMPRQSGIR
jgi:hypothetical protein